MEDQRKGQTTATDLAEAEAEAEGEEEHKMYENVWRDDLQREREDSNTVDRRRDE